MSLVSLTIFCEFDVELELSSASGRDVDDGVSSDDLGLFDAVSGFV